MKFFAPLRNTLWAAHHMLSCFVDGLLDFFQCRGHTDVGDCQNGIATEKRLVVSFAIVRIFNETKNRVSFKQNVRANTFKFNYIYSSDWVLIEIHESRKRNITTVKLGFRYPPGNEISILGSHWNCITSYLHIKLTESQVKTLGLLQLHHHIHDYQFFSLLLVFLSSLKYLAKILNFK